MTAITDRETRRAGLSHSNSSSGKFRPDIEGLRAVAILAVVAYHAKLPGVGSGFVGVDVFFVVSGFLITGMLYRQLALTGTVSLTRFYAARVRRLLPAAGLVAAVTAVAAVALPALQARQVLWDAVASAVYAGNYRFAATGTNYLFDNSFPSPFQHFWSLGVEEQFYVLWPAVILGMAWLGRRYGTILCWVMLGALAIGSFTVCLIWTDTLPPWAFFSLPARAWELAAGAFVALTPPRYFVNALRWLRSRIAAAVPASIAAGASPLVVAATGGWVGLVLIVVASTCLDARTPYPGVAALLPVVGTVLVIGYGGVATKFGVARVLTRPAMRGVGRISYSWYLWHWPLLVLVPRLLGHRLDRLQPLGVVVVAGGLALLTVRLVENPVRFAPALVRSPRRSLACGAAITAATVVIEAGLLAVLPRPVGHGAPAPTVALTAPASGSVPDPVGDLVAQTQAAVAGSEQVRAVPRNLVPSVADGPADLADVFGNGCVRSWREVGQGECAYGDTDSATTVALVGDSHAAMWSPAFEPLAVQRHWRLEVMGKVTCPLLELPITSPYLGRTFTECQQWRSEMMHRLRAERPQLVVLSMSRRYGADFGFVAYDRAWIDSLARLVAALRDNGSAVLVLGPVPDPHATVPSCLAEHLDDATACSPTRAEGVNEAGVTDERAVTTAAGGQYAELTPLFCTAAQCPAIIGNTLVYRDDNHITATYAGILQPVLAAMADRALH